MGVNSAPLYLVASTGGLLSQNHWLDYRLQANRKVREEVSEPDDRDAQFADVNAAVVRYQAEGQPVISVDAKKRKLIGPFKNAGRDWHPKGRAPAVNVYDFPNLSESKALPYGGYDLTENTGWVDVGTDHDTAVFAVFKKPPSTGNGITPSHPKPRIKLDQVFSK